MKKLILACCMLTGFTMFASAQTTPASGTHRTEKTATNHHGSKSSAKTKTTHPKMMKDSTTTTMHKKNTKKKS